MDFLLLYRSTPRLCLHFSYIGPAKKIIMRDVVALASETVVVCYGLQGLSAVQALVPSDYMIL